MKTRNRHVDDPLYVFKQNQRDRVRRLLTGAEQRIMAARHERSAAVVTPPTTDKDGRPGGDDLGFDYRR